MNSGDKWILSCFECFANQIDLIKLIDFLIKLFQKSVFLFSQHHS